MIETSPTLRTRLKPLTKRAVGIGAWMGAGAVGWSCLALFDPLLKRGLGNEFVPPLNLDDVASVASQGLKVSAIGIAGLLLMRALHAGWHRIVHARPWSFAVALSMLLSPVSYEVAAFLTAGDGISMHPWLGAIRLALFGATRYSLKKRP